MFRMAAVLWFVFVTLTPCGRAAEEAEPGSAAVDLKTLPPNTWVPISQGREPPQQFASTWYLPATDAFFIWGKVGGHRHESKWYEVNTLSLSDPAPEWKQSFPLGKEKTWSGGKFPNWGCGCHRLRHKPDRPWRTDVRDVWIGTGKTNVVSLVETDGVLRPTRCPTYDQGAYDTKRDRLLFYVGGKTFAYDPGRREWTDLKAKPPLACDGLVMGTLCYDPVGDRAVLFGGCFALNPWGGAKTWLYDCAKNEWRRAEVEPARQIQVRRAVTDAYERTKGVAYAARYVERYDAPTQKRIVIEARNLEQDIRAARLAAKAALAPRGIEVDPKNALLVGADTVTSNALAKTTKAAELLTAGRSSEAVTALDEAADLLKSGAELLRAEPPLRCNARLVYDAKNRKMVLFGGDAQSRFLADTWTLDPAALRWTNKKPKASPPPLDRYAACFIERHGVVFLVSNPDRIRGHHYRKIGAWTYDTATNEWTPVKGSLPNVNVEWMSCDYSPKDDVVLLTAPGVGTWVYRLDPATAPDPSKDRKTVPSGTWVWNNRSRGMMKSLLGAPQPDPEATKKRLADLPANTPVLAKYPGTLISKTWSSATLDTDRGVVLYIGGGHSGYKGEDLALYDTGTNRWHLDMPPHFIPFLYNYNACLFGWTYGFKPTSQHTYRWYCYDPASKAMVYCARRLGIRNGMTVRLEEDKAKAFRYDSAKHGEFTWVYDTVHNRWCTPLPSRPFHNSWSLALIGTPKGVFAKSGRTLWHGQVAVDGRKATIQWTAVDRKSPSGSGEYQPLVYDATRDRLLFVAVPGKGKPVQVWEHPTGKGAWKPLEVTGKRDGSSREVVYDTVNDCLLAMPRQALMAMDCRTNAWKQLDVSMPKGRYGTECALCYDPVHRTAVALIPVRFSGRMQVVLFRYDPKTAKYRE
jgi:hypothetical protein